MICAAKIRHGEQWASARAAGANTADRLRLFRASTALTSACFTRDSHSSRNACKSLKTNDRVPLYPRRPGARNCAEFSGFAIAKYGRRSELDTRGVSAERSGNALTALATRTTIMPRFWLDPGQRYLHRSERW
jgi:hypothetical protein